MPKIDSTTYGINLAFSSEAESEVFTFFRLGDLVAVAERLRVHSYCEQLLPQVILDWNRSRSCRAPSGVPPRGCCRSPRRPAVGPTARPRGPRGTFRRPVRPACGWRRTHCLHAGAAMPTGVRPPWILTASYRGSASRGTTRPTWFATRRKRAGRTRRDSGSSRRPDPAATGKRRAAAGCGGVQPGRPWRLRGASRRLVVRSAFFILEVILGP
jgi:hypothetical protein